jgi:predicted transcriptional regulator YdeE
MELIEHEEMRLVGLALPHTTTNENGQSAIDCGTLWQQFQNENYYERINSKLNSNVIAVYHGYEGDHTKPYHYFIGCPIDKSAVIPEGLDSLYIPKDVYRKLTAKGIMPDCVADAWRSIWAGDFDLQRAYHFDFELYDERSHDWNNAAVDIFISVV